ncbi:hypothetical protein FB567DRAFT_243248 [Paraphoma chrysanthemicola]|uniref:Uncharacterized protein n=1 Tax=Paraphoma chrysanthemicola TaxID=798071 RepID=A0A8K0QSR3_9PLEO|nr:hypothetical protein FB567DRAFT_243248 [Paraphoma chrysanthemicola]
MSDTSDNAAAVSSLSDHEENCDYHQDPCAGFCTALTWSKKTPCRNRAKILEPGYLPVCKVHNIHKSVRPAGRCQALEDCGQPCNRVAKHHPPYHLCEKHQRGSDTLPCYFMQIPTELRLMVFRYLFPETVLAYAHHVKVAILKVNRLIYQEASSILYGECRFEAMITEMDINLQGKSWDREPFRPKKDDSYAVSDMLCQPGVSRIRKLEISLLMGRMSRPSKIVVSHGITAEEFELYTMRDAVRKLAHAFSGRHSDNEPNGSLNTPRALTSLVVKPTMSLKHSWSPDEAAVALFFVLEPLQVLHKLQHVDIHDPSLDYLYTARQPIFIPKLKNRKIYRKLRKQCLDALTEPDVGSVMLRTWQRAPTEALQNGYRKLEDFAQLVKIQVPSHPWMSGIFQNLDRPLHLARVAYERNDLKMINSIQEAIKLRWVNANRQRQKSLQAMADSINTMFEDDTTIKVENDDDDGLPTPRELYPDAFQFDENEPLKQPYAASQTNMWTELKTEDDAPKSNEDGVTVKTHGMWRLIRKGGKKWYRLTTPAVIREIRADKAAK